VASRRDTSTATIFTIGFTKTSAEWFFTRLQGAAVKKVVDVRLSNTSQLAGFAKKDDLRYFLRVICRIDYEHRVELAPTPELRNASSAVSPVQSSATEDWSRSISKLDGATSRSCTCEGWMKFRLS